MGYRYLKAGCANVGKAMKPIKPLPNRAFIADFTTTTPGETVTFALSNFATTIDTIDYGDGVVGTSNSHTYSTAGTYTVKIYPKANQRVTFSYNNGAGKNNIGLVRNWGDSLIGANAFRGCTNLDLSVVVGVPMMGVNCTNAFRQSGITTINGVSSWDVSGVTFMNNMFQQSQFNSDISSWNVSNVNNMGSMFYGASSFNSDISSWNVSNVNNMNHMFYGASSFNSYIGSWNVSSVIFMNSMFNGATSFNQDIGGWNVSNVINMEAMFQYSPFNQDIGGWDVSSVNNMASMFEDTPFNQDIGGWNVSSVNDMGSMFRNSPFNQDISSWNVSNVNNMNHMFYGASSFNSYIGSWNVSSVIRMESMFQNSYVTAVCLKNATSLLLVDATSFCSNNNTTHTILIENIRIDFNIQFFFLATKQKLLDLCNGGMYNGTFYNGVADMTGETAPTVVLPTATLYVNEQADVESDFNAKNWTVVWV